MTEIVEVFEHALMITGFVFVMMLVIEYLNVLTRGNWDRILGRWKWGQSVFTAALGVTPGCLGAYAVGSLYMHRVISFGALSAAMIATCGDEAFVMLAMFPQKALIIFALLFAVGVVSGMVLDRVLKGKRTGQSERLEHYRPVHEGEKRCIPFSRRELVDQWRRCAPHRGWLTVLLIAFVLAVVSGNIGHHHLGVEGEYADWNWVRVTLLSVGMIGLVIVVTVPDHFLEEHLWNHIAKVHIWRILLWTVAALLAVHVILEYLDIGALITANPVGMLLLACLIGIIPVSGPHLVFVTLYAQDLLPFSILLASCVVQDGHGMIPMLAHSRRAFFAVKLVNFAIGLAIGLLGLLLGW